MAAPLAFPTSRGNKDPFGPSALDRARTVRMQIACDAYDGCFHGGDEQWPIAWEVGRETNPNVIINRCGPAVDTDVAWLMGESVGIALQEGAPAEAQDYLDAAWGVSADKSSDDDKMTLLQELATFGAIYGDAFIKIVWDEENLDQEYPELVVLDPQQVRIIPDPHNVKLVRAYVIEYKVPDARRPDELGTFRQVHERVDPDSANEPEGETELANQPDPDTTWSVQDYYKEPGEQSLFQKQGKARKWDYPWPAIDHCPHLVRPGSVYGRPRITPDVIAVNEAICKIESDINLIGLRHGHPTLFMVRQGAQEKIIRSKVGGILEVSAPIQAVEASGDIPGLRSVRADLDTDFEEGTHIPAQAYGRTDSSKHTGPVSGVGIRLDFAALIADITKEHRTYGALIRRVSQHVLELREPAWGQLGVSLSWPDVLPIDLVQAAQIITSALPQGVMSKQTASEKLLKLDWKQEQANMAEEGPPSPPPGSAPGGLGMGGVGGGGSLIPMPAAAPA